jgi:acyl-CoA dehydrogenase
MSVLTDAAPAQLTESGCYDEAILDLPFFDPAHRELAGQVAAWCASHGELWQDLPGETPQDRGRRILAQLGADGLLAFIDPDRERQPQGDLRSICLAREALAYADDLADYAFSIQSLSSAPIRWHGTREQQRQYLPGMAAGTVQGAFALSEVTAGSDASAVKTTATRCGEGYVLHGSKAWIANGSTADVYCVIARTGEGPGALGLSAFLVPATVPGLRTEPVPLIAPRAFAHVHLEDCFVPADALLGRAGSGYAISMELLAKFRMTVGAAAIGFARRATDTALGHAREREIYEARLLDLPTVQEAFAENATALDASALLVARAAWECDRGNRRYARYSSIAKLHATEAAQQIVDSCVQILGAAGLIAGSVTEKLYRQVRALRIYEGASEVQKMIIAGSLVARRPRTVSKP